VKWSGNNFSAGGGVFDWETYDLVSECKCGQKVHARVKAYGLSYGRGVTFAGSSVDLDDHAACPDPQLLAGDYFRSSVGAAGIFGLQFSTVILGSASSPGSWGMEFGLDASIGSTFGKSVLEWSFSEPCTECNNK
jgi:hypothetical protein